MDDFGVNWARAKNDQHLALSKIKISQHKCWDIVMIDMVYLRRN